MIIGSGRIEDLALRLAHATGEDVETAIERAIAERLSRIAAPADVDHRRRAGGATLQGHDTGCRLGVYFSGFPSGGPHRPTRSARHSVCPTLRGLARRDLRDRSSIRPGAG